MRLIWILTLGLFGLAVAPAQDGRGGGRGRFPTPNVGFTTLDLNGDGVLDAQEIDAAPTSLARLDKNADRQITTDEARPPMMGGRGRGGQEGGAPSNVVEETVKTLMSFDANGDGKLSKSELPERFQGIFDRGDENKDGFLTPEEIRKMATAQAAASGGTGGRGPEGGRGEGGRGEGPRGNMNFIRMDPVLAAVDTNGDGIISADEIRDSAAALRKLDKDGDGKVTRDEAMPATGRGREF
jgi:Ca2+-binding EF-hand superfamily protein